MPYISIFNKTKTCWIRNNIASNRFILNQNEVNYFSKSSSKLSKIVFEGKVTGIISDKFYNYQGRLNDIINFDVTKNYKKTKVGEGTISLIDSRSSCSFYFEPNKTYIVFAYDMGGGYYYTSTCAKTSLIERFSEKKQVELDKSAANYKLDLTSDIRTLVINGIVWDQLNDKLNTSEDRIKRLKENILAWQIITFAVLVFLGLLIWKIKKYSK